MYSNEFYSDVNTLNILCKAAIEALKSIKSNKLKFGIDDNRHYFKCLQEAIAIGFQNLSSKELQFFAGQICIETIKDLQFKLTSKRQNKSVRDDLTEDESEILLTLFDLMQR